MVIREVVQFVDDLTGIDNTVDALGALDSQTKKVFSKMSGLFDEAKKAASAADEEIRETAKALKEEERAARRAESATGKFTKRLKDKVKNLKVAGVEVSKLSQALKVYRTTNLTLAQSMARVGINTDKLRVAFNLLGKVPLFLALTAIVVVLGTLVAAAQRSQKIMDKFRQVGAAISAVIDVLTDRVTFLGRAFSSLLSLDFAGFRSESSKAFSGLGEELKREAINAFNLEKAIIAVQRSLEDLEFRESSIGLELKKLEKTSQDITKGVNAQLTAEEKRAKLIKENVAAQLDAQTKLLGFTLFGNEKLTRANLETIEELKRNGVSAIEEIGGVLADEGARDDLKNQLLTVIGLEEELYGVQIENEGNVKAIRKDANDRYLEALDKRKRIEAEIAAAREGIAQRLDDLIREGLEGEDGIDADRRRAQAEIDALEKVTRATFKENKKRFDLEESFAQLRLETNKKIDRQLSEFRIAEAKKTIDSVRERQEAEIDLLTITGEDEISIEEFKAKEKARIRKESLIELRKITAQEFGEDSLEVLKVDVDIKGTETAFVDATKKGIDARLRLREKEAAEIKELGQAEIDLVTKSTDKTLSLENFKQREKLRLEVDFLKARQQVLADDPNSTANQRKLIDLQIKAAEKAISDISKIKLSPLERIKKGIAEALKIDDATLDGLLQQVGGIISNIADGITANIERQISEYDNLIARLDEQIAETQESLDEQLALREQGFANDAGLFEAALAQEQAARAAALEEKQALEKKAARQQLIVDAAQQASALALAAAQLLAAEASKGVIGIVLAAGGLAAAFALFSRYKAQSAQITGDIPELREGGRLESGKLKGPSHKDGGIKVRDADSKIYEVEGKEWMINRKSSEHYDTALAAINSGEMDRLSPFDALRLLGKDGGSDGIKRVGSYARKDSSYSGASGVDTKQLGDLYKEANKDIVQAIEEQPMFAVMPDGSTIEIRRTKHKRTKKITRKL